MIQRLLIIMVIGGFLFTGCSNQREQDLEKKLDQMTQRAVKAETELKRLKDIKKDPMGALEQEFQKRQEAKEASDSTHMGEDVINQKNHVEQLKKWKAEHMEMEKKIKEFEKWKKQREQQYMELKQLNQMREEQKRINEFKKSKDIVNSALCDKQPVKITSSPIEFPVQVKKKYKGQKWNARAILMIDKTGTVKALRMLNDLPPDLEEHFSKSLSKWKYEPAEKSGQKVNVWMKMEIPIAF